MFNHIPISDLLVLFKPRMDYNVSSGYYERCSEAASSTVRGSWTRKTSRFFLILKREEKRLILALEEIEAELEGEENDYIFLYISLYLKSSLYNIFEIH